VDATLQTKVSIYSWVAFLFSGIVLGHLVGFHW